MDTEDRADKYGDRQRLLALTQTGETAAILNGDQFQPKNW